MRIETLSISGLAVIDPPRFADPRGVMAVTWNQAALDAAGIPVRFVQDNHSVSLQTGTIRGLHCQVGANAQGKLVRVVRGSVWDVAVDVRPGSPSFGRWDAVELSAANWRQIWIPAGFLHGFCTLEPDTEVIYKVTAPYDPSAERGVRWDDPDLALPWPVAEGAAILSDKDLALPSLAAAGFAA